MSGRSAEFLVLLSDEGGPHGLEGLTDLVRVSQVGSPRLAIVEAPAEAAQAALRSRRNVAAVAGPGETLEGAAELTPQERLFADAWSQRSESGRAGEGLAWDAPGFAPPDPPESGD